MFGLLAFVFHWPPSAIESIPLSELGQWLEQARKLKQAEGGVNARRG